MNPYAIPSTICFVIAAVLGIGEVGAAAAHLTWLVALLMVLGLLAAMLSGAAAAMGWMLDQERREGDGPGSES